MSSAAATPLVIDIAKSFIVFVRKVEPQWQKAYLRFVSHGSDAEAKASYSHTAGVEIVNVLQHKEYFHAVTKQGLELLAVRGKDQGVFLLITDSSFNYDIKFEYRDLHRWRISKLAGGTGVPEGIE